LTTLGIRETISTKLLLDLLRSQDDQKRRDIRGVIDHLVENSGRLQEDDWNYLKESKFLPCLTLVQQKTGEKILVKGFSLADKLVFPDEKLLSLGFSVLDWGSSSSASASSPISTPSSTVPPTSSAPISASITSHLLAPFPKLHRNVLNRIGVQNHPDLRSLLNVAVSSNDLQVAINAILYFLEYYEKTYKHTYQKQGPSGNLAFIPVLPSTPSSVIRRTPAECYLAPTMSEGLASYLSLKGVVIPELSGLLKGMSRTDSPSPSSSPFPLPSLSPSNSLYFQLLTKEKQLIEGHPPLKEVLDTLQLKGLPVSLAKEMFSVFILKYMTKMTDGNWKSLSESSFIPISLGTDGTTPSSFSSSSSSAPSPLSTSTSSTSPASASTSSSTLTSPSTLGGTGVTKWMKPSELVFFSEALKKEFDNLLDYVPMEYGKMFLQGCGVVSYPGDEAFAR
jgi:hypothetical protein